MRRFSGQSGSVSGALGTLHQRLAPMAAARRGGGDGKMRDALALSRLAREGAFDLRILVVRAEGLVKADLMGLSDPYVVVRLNWSGEHRALAGDEAGTAAKAKSSMKGSRVGGEKEDSAGGVTTKRSACVKNPLAPTWNEPLEMLSIPPPRVRSGALARGAQAHHTLSFAVVDNDAMSADDVIGCAPPLEVHSDPKSKSAQLSLRAGLDAANMLCRVVVDGTLEGEFILFEVPRTFQANPAHNLTRSPYHILIFALEGAPSICERKFKASDAVPFKPVPVDTHWFGATDPATGRKALHKGAKARRACPQRGAIEERGSETEDRGLLESEAILRVATSLELPLLLQNQRVGALHVRIWIAKPGRLPMVPLPIDLPELGAAPREDWPARSLTSSGVVINTGEFL